MMLLTVAPEGHHCGRLLNWQYLSSISSQLSHLPKPYRNDRINLIHSYPILFTDVLSQTTVLQHDIEVSVCCSHQIACILRPLSEREVIKTEVEYLLMC